MYVYVWGFPFIENCDDSGGNCFAVAFSKEEAVQKIVKSFRDEQTGEYDDDLDERCTVLKSLLLIREPIKIIQVENFVYPPGGYGNKGIRFYEIKYYGDCK